MEFLPKILNSAQIILAIVLIISVILQERSAGIGGALGGGDDSVTYSKRRGFEKFIFTFTIVVGVLFVIAVLLSHVLI